MWRSHNVTRTYFLFMLLGILTPLMLLLGGAMESVEVSAQGGFKETPHVTSTIDPALEVTLAPSEYELPSYQTEPEVLPDNTTIEGRLSADQTRYVYLYRGAERTIPRYEVSSGTPNFDFRIIDPTADPTQTTFSALPAIESEANNIPQKKFFGNYYFEKAQEVWFVVYNTSGHDLTYTITISLHNVPELISYGNTVTGNLGFTEEALVKGVFYDFYADAGDLIQVSVNSELDTQLVLTDFEGLPIALDDGGGAGFNPEIYHQPLPKAGFYHLILSFSEDPNTILPKPYTYELTLTESAYHVIAPNSPVQPDYSNGGWGDTLVFEGKAGQFYALEIAVQVLKAPVVIVVWQEDQNLAEIYIPERNIANSAEVIHLEFTSVNDGEVRIVVSHSFSDTHFLNVAYLTLNLVEH